MRTRDTAYHHRRTPRTLAGRRGARLDQLPHRQAAVHQDGQPLDAVMARPQPPIPRLRPTASIPPRRRRANRDRSRSDPHLLGLTVPAPPSPPPPLARLQWDGIAGRNPARLGKRHQQDAERAGRRWPTATLRRPRLTRLPRRRRSDRTCPAGSHPAAAPVPAGPPPPGTEGFCDVGHVEPWRVAYPLVAPTLLSVAPPSGAVEAAPPEALLHLSRFSADSRRGMKSNP